jgi:hypothetical protein
MQAVAEELTRHLSVVTDETGLWANYDFIVTFSLPRWNLPTAVPPGALGDYRCCRRTGLVARCD